MNPSLLRDHSHRRYNPLTKEWVLVSPHRTQRPWLGKVEEKTAPAPQFDPQCYLCPGNQRAGGVRNPTYPATFVFDNDFGALQPDLLPVKLDQDGKGLLVAEAEAGLCRVVCFSPRHDLTISLMESNEVLAVVDTWTHEYRTLGSLPQINYVQIFENRGAVMGCSNPHPHGQIWANATIPNEPRKEQSGLIEYRVANGSCMLCDYVATERSAAERIVFENEHFVCLVPFWAVWPFETMLLAKRHFGNLPAMRQEERQALAEMLKRLTTRYDNLFEVAFPYSMGFHQSPTDNGPHDEWHFHAHYYPPLLRSATVKKFLVGYEMLASPQRDITPEFAAERLRALSDKHYTLPA